MKHVTSQTIAVSQAAARSLGRIGDQLGRRLHVIYSAVDCQKFAPEHRNQSVREELNVPPESPLIGLVARLQGIKGQKVFLRAAHLVNKLFPEARFLIAGKGSWVKREVLANHAKELGIDHCLIVRGWLANLPAVLASLDVSVCASLGSEGSSRIAYETMASGVPFVGTQVGCLPEIIEHGKTGLLVPPNHPEALAGAICDILRHPELGQTMAANALHRARTFYTFERWINQILEVYEKSLRKEH